MSETWRVSIGVGVRRGGRQGPCQAKSCRPGHLGSAQGPRAVQSLTRVRLCDPVDCSMPGSSVRSHLPEFAQVHAH